MTNEFSQMLQLFVNGALGKKTKLPNNADIEKLISLAKEHNIYYSVLEALLSSDIKFDNNGKYKKTIENVRLMSYMKYFKYSEIFKIFEEKHIPYALLKGYSVARFYNSPYTRLSADTDVLINKDDEKDALAILKEFGFELVELSTSEMKHSVLSHPELGILELHIALYNKNTKKIWFDDDGSCWEVSLSFDKLNKIPFDDRYYYTLSADENIIFVFEHIVKHFIYGGVSIRAFVDFCLTYLNDNIDYNLFYERVSQKGYKTIFDSIIAVVKRYINEDAIYFANSESVEESLVLALLDDMEKGKWLGCAAEIDASAVENAILKENGRGGMPPSVFRKIFPEVRMLKNNYKYAMCHPVLIPVAWCHRLFKFVFSKRKTSGSDDVLNNTRSRIELLKKMNLI